MRSRRDTHQLNAAPQLSLQSFTGLGSHLQETQDGIPTEGLKVNNLDTSTVVLSRVSSTLDPSLVSTLSASIAPGSAYLLESGVSGDTARTPNASLATLWTTTFVCRDGDSNPLPGAGYTLTAAQSGATTTYQFSVLCNEIADFSHPGAHHHHQNHQQHAHHHHKRQQHKRRQHKKQQHHHHGGGATAAAA